MVSNTEKYKEIIVPIVLKYLPNVSIILYGSRARGDNQEGSDIDIALNATMKIKEEIMIAIKNDLEDSKLPICFDIVDFHAISGRLRDEIEKHGIVWIK